MAATSDQAQKMRTYSGRSGTRIVGLVSRVRELVLLVFQYAGGSQVSASDVPDSFLSLATAPFLGVPLLIWFAVALALIFAYLLRSSRTGRQLYAIGSNPDAARLAGIRSGLLVFGAF